MADWAARAIVIIHRTFHYLAHFPRGRELFHPLLLLFVDGQYWHLPYRSRRQPGGRSPYDWHIHSDGLESTISALDTKGWAKCGILPDPLCCQQRRSALTARLNDLALEETEAHTSTALASRLGTTVILLTQTTSGYRFTVGNNAPICSEHHWVAYLLLDPVPANRPRLLKLVPHNARTEARLQTPIPNSPQVTPTPWRQRLSNALPNKPSWTSLTRTQATEILAKVAELGNKNPRTDLEERAWRCGGRQWGTNYLAASYLTRATGANGWHVKATLAPLDARWITPAGALGDSAHTPSPSSHLLPSHWTNTDWQQDLMIAITQPSSNHFCTLFLYRTARRVIVMDSLTGPTTQRALTKHAASWTRAIVRLATNLGHAQLWGAARDWRVEVGQSPQQHNSHDCCFYAIAAAEAGLTNTRIVTSSSTIYQFRAHVARAMLRGQLGGAWV